MRPPSGVRLRSYSRTGKSPGGATRGRVAVRHPGERGDHQRAARRSVPPVGRVPVRTRLDFWFDGVLLAAYTLVYSLGFTGLAIHEWLGLGIGLALLLHLTLHWDWVVRTTRKLLVRGGRDRGIWLLNLALLVVMTLCVLSGVLVSQVALHQLGISRSPRAVLDEHARHHRQADPDPRLGARRGALAMDRQRRPPPARQPPARPLPGSR